MYDLNALVKVLAKSKLVAVLTGAGVSQESGIATFRDPDGLWAKFNPMELASMDGFMSNPELVWQWYGFRREVMAKCEPNAGHFALAEMENLFEEFSLATQNVDRFHQRAGSRNVHELHGNIIDNFCCSCGAPYLDEINLDDKSPVKCKVCSKFIRPAVVWFGEMLPADALNAASWAAENCDVYFSIGTSAEVYPAAQLPQLAKRRGAYLVEINPNETSLSRLADMKIALPSSRALPMILEAIKNV